MCVVGARTGRRPPLLHCRYCHGLPPRTRSGAVERAGERAPTHGRGGRQRGGHPAAEPHHPCPEARGVVGRVRPDDRLLPPAGPGPPRRGPHRGAAHPGHRVVVPGLHPGHLVRLPHRAPRVARCGAGVGRSGRVPGLLRAHRRRPPAQQFLLAAGRQRLCGRHGGGGGPRPPGPALVAGVDVRGEPRPSATPSPPR